MSKKTLVATLVTMFVAGLICVAMAVDMPVVTVGSIKSGPKTYLKQTMTVTISAVNGTTGYIDILPSNAIPIGAKVSISTACNGTSPTLVLGDSSNSTYFGTFSESSLNATGVYNLTPNANFGTVNKSSRSVKYLYTATSGGTGRIIITLDYLR